jgi:DNA-binding transcriptional MerR regulator
MNSSLTIKEVAAETGLTAYTLRYYERIGLIAPIKRAPSGQRRYAASDMDWLKFLLRLRATNMPIAQMQAFALLRAKGNSTAAKRREILEQHLQKVNADMQELRRCAKVLQEKVQHYQALESTSAQRAKPGKRKKKGKSHDTQPL